MGDTYIVECMYADTVPLSEAVCMQACYQCSYRFLRTFEGQETRGVIRIDKDLRVNQSWSDLNFPLYQGRITGISEPGDSCSSA